MSTAAPSIPDMAKVIHGLNAGTASAEEFRAVMRASRDARGEDEHNRAKAKALHVGLGD